MNIIPQIRKNIVSLFKQERGVLIAFIILPLIMALIYGMMNSHSFNGKVSIDPIKVNLIYDNTSQTGKILSSVLDEDEVKSFIEIEKEGYECEVKISDDFKNIDINNIKATSNKIDLLSNFLESFNSDVEQINTIHENVDKSSLSEEKKNMVMGNIVKKLSENQNKSSVIEKIVDGYKTLDVKEYYGISTFTFTSIMLIIFLANKFFDEKQQGVIRRTFATPTRKQEYMVGFIISSTIVAFIINFIYVLINIGAGLAFKENFIGVLVILVIQSLFQGAIAGVLIAFVKEKIMVTSIIGFFVILSAVAGGSFINIDAMDSPALKILGNFSPNTLILNAYKSLAISNSMNEALVYIVSMLIISLVFIILSMIKIKVRWEE